MTKLTPRQAAGVSAILSTGSMEAAARQAGTSSKTLRRWLGLPTFQAALTEGRRTAFSAALNDLRLAASEAVAALRRIVGNPKIPAGVVVQAAHAILTHAFKGVELADVLERIQALEEANPNATRNYH